MVKRQSE